MFVIIAGGGKTGNRPGALRSGHGHGPGDRYADASAGYLSFHLVQHRPYPALGYHTVYCAIPGDHDRHVGADHLRARSGNGHSQHLRKVKA